MPKIFLLSLLLTIGQSGWPTVISAETHTVPEFARIPPRPIGALTGSQFAQKLAQLPEEQHQPAALAALRSGNVPSFLRRFVPVTMKYLTEDGDEMTMTIRVAPDYLAIGSDHDFIRIPLSYSTAVAIAAEFGCVLPTRKIVDAIYQQANFRYTPRPLPPGPQMRGVAYHVKHQRLIEQQKSGAPTGELVSGHKKDLVISNRLWRQPDRVAIYGWHKPDGEPIQSLSTYHGARYLDYSHGLRLVSRTVSIDHQPYSIYDVLSNPQFAPALTYEGQIMNFKGLMKNWQSQLRAAQRP